LVPKGGHCNKSFNCADAKGKKAFNEARASSGGHPKKDKVRSPRVKGKRGTDTGVNQWDFRPSTRARGQGQTSTVWEKKKTGVLISGLPGEVVRDLGGGGLH